MSDEPTVPQKKKNTESVAEPGSYEITGYAPTAWHTATYASSWFSDALSQAQPGADRHARRREIVFAVCAAESYLLEWVRDEVLKGDYGELDRFFPRGRRAGVWERFKIVTNDLLTAGLIGRKPDFGGSTWNAFYQLLCYRDALVHGAASRPESGDQPVDPQGKWNVGFLSSLSPGWAVSVVFDLIGALHTSAGTSPPDWLKRPTAS
jgi:hypothetical protein